MKTLLDRMTLPLVALACLLTARSGPAPEPLTRSGVAGA